MNRLRPSIGEFSGSFNLSDDDYSKLKTEYSTRFNVDDNLPSLSKNEIESVQDRLRNFLMAWREVQSTSVVQCLGTERYYALDEQSPHDRTCNVWVSTCTHLNLPMIDELRAIVSNDLPLWRVILRVPHGETPDITIYRDCYLCGEIENPSEGEFETLLAEWKAAEEKYVAGKSAQVLKLVRRSPLSNLDETGSIFQLAFFSTPFGDVENERLDATLWVGSSGSVRGVVPHRIKFALIDGIQYRPSIFSFEGSLTGPNGWQFEKALDACGQILPIPVPTSSEGRVFVLVGFDNQTNSRWELDGIVGTANPDSA